MPSGSMQQLEEGDDLTDLVTGLAKPFVELEHARYAIDRARHTRTHVGAVVVDIDGFGRIDEEWGWGAGDLVLRAVGQRIRSVLRDDDRATRLGGDVFAAFSEGLASPAIIESVRRRIHDVLGRPVPVDGTYLLLHVSTGTATCPGTGTPEDLIGRAEDDLRRRRRPRDRMHAIPAPPEEAWDDLGMDGWAPI